MTIDGLTNYVRTLSYEHFLCKKFEVSVSVFHVFNPETIA